MTTVRGVGSGMDSSFFGSYSFLAVSSVAAATILVRIVPQYSVLGSTIWTSLAIFGLQWLVHTIYIVLLYPFYFSPLRHLPGPTGNSFFNGQWATLVKDPSGIPMRRWVNEIPNDGLIRYLHLYNRERLLITSPKALSEVMVTKSYDFIKPELLRRGIGRILGMGILFAEGDDHKMQRKSLAPAFNFRHIKQLYPLFWAKSREMVECIQRETSQRPDKPSVEVGNWASRATLDIIGVGGLGQDFNSLADPNTELNSTYRSIFSPSRTGQLLGLLGFFIPPIILRNLPIKHNDDINAASRVARDTSRRLIQQKKIKLANKEEGSPDIISIALESGSFTDDDLVNNMMTFLAAGHETTAAAFTWAIYLICQNPDVQTQLREEVHARITGLNSTINSDLIDNMPYLHAVCQEVLRFYAPVPLTLRDTAVDTTICNQFVPRGTKVFLVPWAINFSKHLWGPDADQFKPSRWMGPGRANSGGAESNFSFMTFLHGPRGCIGSKFALAELACLLAAFVGKFEFKQTNPEEEIVIKGGITARPKNGMTIDVKALDW